MNTKKGKYSLEKLSGVWAVMMAGRYVLETFSTEGHAAHALRGYEVGKRFVKEKQNVWVVDDAYVANRVRQVEYLWKQLDEIGVPIVKPVGGHAVYIDAKAMLPHIPQSQFPACVLANELYIESGVRGCGYGAMVFSHKDEKTGEMIYPKQEYARLAIPRRVYTDRHMDVVAEGFRRVNSRRDKLKGLKIIYQPPGPIGLRHFTVRMEPVE